MLPLNFERKILKRIETKKIKKKSQNKYDLKKENKKEEDEG